MSRLSIARLRRQVLEARAAMPPVVQVAAPGFPERVAEAHRAAEAVRATGRRAFVVLVDREDEP